MSNPVFEIKKQPGGKFDEKSRLDLITILANAGYTVGMQKLDGRSEYVVKIYEPERK